MTPTVSGSRFGKIPLLSNRSKMTATASRARFSCAAKVYIRAYITMRPPFFQPHAKARIQRRPGRELLQTRPLIRSSMPHELE